MGSIRSCGGFDPLTHRIVNSMPARTSAQRDDRSLAVQAEVLRQREKMAEEWEATIMNPKKLLAQASEAFLFQICLRLMKCCNVDEPVFFRKLYICLSHAACVCSLCSMCSMHVYEFVHMPRASALYSVWMYKV